MPPPERPSPAESRTRGFRPLERGYDVDANAIRFSSYFHVLREIVHRSCG